MMVTDSQCGGLHDESDVKSVIERVAGGVLYRRACAGISVQAGAHHRAVLPPAGRQTFTRALLASACRMRWGSRSSSTTVRAQASIIGTDAVAKSPADGYTLLMMSNTHTVNESLIPNKPYQLMRDFVPVAPINYSDLVLVVHPSVPANNLAELLQLAKAKPKELNYASSGNGTPYHMAGELFKAMAGVDIVHVPYKGSAGARTDVLGGQVQMMFDAVPTMSDHVRSGKVKAFGTTGEKRSAVLPERSDDGGSGSAGL